jgi:hypothetical protein
MVTYLVALAWRDARRVWEELGVTRRLYEQARPWEAAGLTRRRYERLMLSLPREELRSIVGKERDSSRKSH